MPDDTDNNNQEIQLDSAPPDQTIPFDQTPKSRGSSNKIMIIGVLIVIVLLAVAYLAFFKNASSTSSTTSISSAPKNSSTISTAPSSTTSVSSITSNSGIEDLNNSGGGGKGQSYMSKSEVISLLGAGGIYSAAYNSRPIFSQQYSQQYGVLINNVTALWGVEYKVTPNATITEEYIKDVVCQTTKAKYLYTKELDSLLASNETTAAVVLNVTTNGLTYSYTRHGNVFDLLGYKNNELVGVTSPYELNQTKLAEVLAGDMP